MTRREIVIKALQHEETEKLLIAVNEAPPTTLRVNTLLTDRDALLKNIPSSIATINAPYGILVNGSIRDIYGFDEGAFFVQDEASQICVEVLDAKRGEFIMDICACSTICTLSCSCWYYNWNYNFFGKRRLERGFDEPCNCSNSIR